MSDHEFEKQVRQKLSNLKITPSAQTWENIANQIHPRKRRSPWFWMPAALLVLAAGGYWLTRQAEPAAQPVVAENPLMPAGSSRGNQAGDGPSAAIAGSNALSDQAPAGTATPAAPSLSPGQPDVLRKDARDGAFSPARRYRDRHTAPANGTAAAPNGVSTTTYGVSPRLQTSSVVAPRSAPIAGSTAPNPRQLAASLPAVVDPASGFLSPADRVTITPRKRFSLLMAPAQSDKTAGLAGTAPKPARHPSESKWSFGVNGYSGIVALKDGGLFRLGKAKVEDVAYTPNFANVSGNAFPQYKPSTISPGPGFSAGAEVKRRLSPRLSVSAGLNYLQFNTRSTVGERVNSSQIVNNGTRGYLYVQSYYLLDPNENTEYKNKYHFIELPITLHTCINNSEALPVYWNLGISVSRLLSSTSLHFDGTTGVYYKNDQLLNQTQTGLTTGFSLALFNRSAHPLWVGPFAQSNLSTVLKKDISSSNHFATVGLELKWWWKR